MEKISMDYDTKNIEDLTKNLSGLYDIVFIGGGPATLAFISFLFRNSLIEKYMKLKILIIEKSSSFGSGCLGKFGINSNTSAEGFVRLICSSTEANSKSNDKNALSPEKTGKKKDLIPMPLFMDIYKSSNTESLLALGSKVTPLPLAAQFLQEVGNSFLSTIHKQFKKLIFLGETEVINIKVFDKPTIYCLNLKKNGNKNYSLKTKTVVFACGAIQYFDSKVKSCVLNSVSFEGFYNSDYFLQESGYIKALQYLENIRSKNNSTNKLKIVIIGGSHSGFSCAWILINGYTKFSNNSKNPYSLKVNDNTNNKDLCNCNKSGCICYGTTSKLNWANKYKSSLVDLEIIITYRDHIRVYYSTEKEALNDGYNVYDPSKCVNKNSNVYPFIGIRGDAKELYRSIVSGREKRVTLHKCKKDDEISNITKSASLVIWAGGYTTNTIPLVDNTTNKELKLYCDEGTTCEVSKELLVLDSNKKEIKNMLGIGQGFSTFSIEVLTNGKKGKADSVNLYLTHISKKLHKSLEEIINNNKNLYTNVSKLFDIRPNGANSNKIVKKEIDKSTKDPKKIDSVNKEMNSNITRIIDSAKIKKECNSNKNSPNNDKENKVINMERNKIENDKNDIFSKDKITFNSLSQSTKVNKLNKIFDDKEKLSQINVKINNESKQNLIPEKHDISPINLNKSSKYAELIKQDNNFERIKNVNTNFNQIQLNSEGEKSKKTVEIFNNTITSKSNAMQNNNPNSNVSLKNNKIEDSKNGVKYPKLNESKYNFKADNQINSKKNDENLFRKSFVNERKELNHKMTKNDNIYSNLIINQNGSNNKSMINDYYPDNKYKLSSKSALPTEQDYNNYYNNPYYNKNINSNQINMNFNNYGKKDISESIYKLSIDNYNKQSQIKDSIPIPLHTPDNLYSKNMIYGNSEKNNNTLSKSYNNQQYNVLNQNNLQVISNQLVNNNNNNYYLPHNYKENTNYNNTNKVHLNINNSNSKNIYDNNRMKNSYNYMINSDLQNSDLIHNNMKNSSYNKEKYNNNRYS